PASRALHPLLGQRLYSPVIKEILFESRLSVDAPPFLADHRLFGDVAFPAGAYVEMVLAAAREVFGAGPQVLEDVSIHEALVLSEGAQTIQIILAPAEDGASAFQIFSRMERADAEQ